MSYAGRTVKVEIRPGLESYNGSSRNGVNSENYSGWSGSFVFVR
ncbi:LCCL domain-containing protein [Spirosoma aureum]